MSTRRKRIMKIVEAATILIFFGVGIEVLSTITNNPNYVGKFVVLLSVTFLIIYLVSDKLAYVVVGDLEEK